MRRFLTGILLMLTGLSLTAQMTFRSQSLYGNEWIQPNQNYYKIHVAADGIYSVSFQQLEQAGIPAGSISADKFKLIRFGSELPMIRSTEGIMSATDYLQFFGQRNRSELDEPLFNTPAELMNREYSLFNDTSAYFLTWSDQPTAAITKVNNDLTSVPAKEEYFINNKISYFTEAHFKRGVDVGYDDKFPLFDACQGYSTPAFVTRTFPLDFGNYYVTGPDANINVAYGGFGQDNSMHQITFTLDGNKIDQDDFTGYQMRYRDLKIPATSLRNQLQLQIDAIGGFEDFVAISVIDYRYPSTFNFNQKKTAKIILDAGPNTKYIEINNFNGGDEIIVFDRTNQQYLLSAREANGSYRIHLPASSQQREIWIFNKSEIKTITRIDKVNFLTLNPGDFNYLLLYHSKLTDDGQGNNYVQQYIDYRSSTAGGSYKVAAVNVEDLYDLFAYGIHTHTLAVKNFAQYIHTIWPNLKYFFVMGKGLEYPSYRKTGLDPNYFFIPTYSIPAADMMLITDKNKEPLYAFGRLPVINGTEIRYYLDKVKSHESYINSTQHNIESREWPKRVVHLSGGDPQLYTWISGVLRNMEDTIENNLFGAHVETYYKQSSNTIEVANSEKMKKSINEGSSIIAFMGHSASVRLDFNLENVDSYKNKDRYHLFMAMGCYAGAMFWPNRSISEDHNLAQDKGSIVYLANTTAGLPNFLGIYGSELYNQLGTDNYGQSIGDAMKVTFSKLQKIGSAHLLTQAYSTSYNGDPAIHLNVNKNQDYTIDAKTVTTNPSLVFNSQDKFELAFDVTSLGAYFKDSLLITVEKKLPSGKRLVVYNSKIANPGWKTTVKIQIPVGGEEATGYNTLYVKLDALNEIPEGPLSEAETNNELVINGETGYTLYVFGNEARPVYPPEFAIVSDSDVKLIASNGNTFAIVTNYYIELDTTEYFNSPLKRSTTVKQTGGVISWQPNASLIPNTVYYWRAAPDSTGAGVFAWRTSSFIYIPGSPDGWNQSHFFQHRRNDFFKMNIKEPDRNFTYADAFIEFRVNNGNMPQPSFIRPRVYVGSDVASDYRYMDYKNMYSGVIVNVFDPVTGRMWVNQTGSDYNSVMHNNFVGRPFFVYKTSSSTERAALIAFLENIIPDNHVVVFSTISQNQYSYFPEQWESDGTTNIYSVLESQGAKSVRNLKNLNSVPYVVIYRKGRTDFEVREMVGNFTDEIDISHSFAIAQTSGGIQSKLVGPAKSWSNYLWDYKSLNPAEDLQEINIYGVDTDGNDFLLFGPFTDAQQQLTSIDAKKYPQLKLEWKTSDTTTRTSPAIDYWRVLYEGLPDAAFNPALTFEKNKDTLYQGDLFNVKIAAQNISAFDMDSLLVKFTIVNNANQQTISYTRFLPLNSLASLTIPFSFNTSKVFGAHKLFIELNPNSDQPELHSFNNTAIIPFYIRRNNRKPFMEVTFDKHTIIDQEIVASNALIEIVLKDDAKDLLSNDTSIFTIKLKEPGGAIRRVYFAENNVSFVPATTGDNTVKAVIKGDFRRDGIYTLFVTAEDGTGNSATEQEYIVDFTVVIKSSVGNLFNYPNPFSTKTRFVYTLTGSALPENYMLQILTVSGKVVRVITKEELGPLSIGTHMTEFEYTGTDDFGEKLANGVYLYRFVVKDKNNNSWEKYDTQTEQYFKNDFGKMVILR